MRFRKKLVYFILGFVFCFISQIFIFSIVPRVTAKSKDKVKAVEGKVGDTLNNDYYSVTVAPTSSRYYFNVKVTNIGNDKVTYISGSNFRAEYDDDEGDVLVKWLDDEPTGGVVLDIGQTKKFERVHADVDEKKYKFVFQAYTEAAINYIENARYGGKMLSFPAGEKIGKPIIFQNIPIPDTD